MENFVVNFADQFDITDPAAFSADTSFKKLDEWSSLLALSVVAMVDEKYGVRIKGDDIKSANTIADLFNIVKSRM